MGSSVLDPRTIPLHRLRGWFDVLRWVRVGEQDAVSLCRVAFVSHRDPAACYRLVKRVTGHAWSEVRTLGSDWVTARISELLHEGGRAPGQLDSRGVSPRESG